MPDGVLINGKGPYRYDNTLVPDGIEYETIQIDPCNVFSALVGKNVLNHLLSFYSCFCFHKFFFSTAHRSLFSLG